jgi:hypothetical protein
MLRVSLAVVAGLAVAWLIVAALGKPPVACHLSGALPDRNCTPGTRSRLVAQQVCRLGPRGPLPGKLVAFTYDLYGIGPEDRESFRVEELIPRQLGGGLRRRNLWPAPLEVAPGVTAKDELEVRLRQQVCAGRLSLRAAQDRIAHNWVAAYRQLH